MYWYSFLNYLQNEPGKIRVKEVNFDEFQSEYIQELNSEISIHLLIMNKLSEDRLSNSINSNIYEYWKHIVETK